MSNQPSASKAPRFEKYADTHPMGGPVSDFEQAFYRKYLSGFSGKILDIGCGDGKYISHFRSECPNSIVMPCDLSFKRIKRVYEHAYGGVVGSAERLPFKDNSFERVFLMQVIEHVPNPDVVIAECKRVLKGNGYCFVLTPNYPAKRFYDWLEVLRFQKWKKVFDDPTHCSKLSWTQLEKALKQHFRQVDIVSTFVLGEKIPQIKAMRERKNNFTKLFSHKILAVCQP